MSNLAGLPLRPGVGAVILRCADTETVWLAIVREQGGTLTLPKGGIECGEDPLIPNCVESKTKPTNGSSKEYRLAAMETYPALLRIGWNQSKMV